MASKLDCIQTGKLKDVRGRRVTGYFARIRDLNVSGSTPAEALGRLSQRVEEICQYRMPRYRTIKGIGTPSWTLIISPCPDQRGCYTFLVWPDGHVSESCTPENDYRKIEVEERLHVAQVWYGEQHKICQEYSREQEPCPDDCKAGLADCYQIIEGTGKESEFGSWVKFQELYREARRRGFTDVEAHMIAGNHPMAPKLESKGA